MVSVVVLLCLGSLAMLYRYGCVPIKVSLAFDVSICLCMYVSSLFASLPQSLCVFLTSSLFLSAWQACLSLCFSVHRVTRGKTDPLRNFWFYDAINATLLGEERF